MAEVSARGGVASGRELIAAGVSRRDLTRAVASGWLSRPRLGWYSTLSPSHPRYRAVRIGGRLTGASALADMGAWMLSVPARIEVAIARGSARLRPDAGATLHWIDDPSAPTSAAVVGVGSALIRVILDHDLETSVPCVDWALSTQAITQAEWRRLVETLPAPARCIRRWVDPRSESVLESVARVRLVRAGFPVRSQVPVGWSQAIDLVIADQVAMELDGKEHHEATFEADRRKDLRITAEGRHPLRVSFRMLQRDWPEVEAAVRAALRARGVSPAQDSVAPPPEPRGTRARRVLRP
ncbi:MAG: type IV toxin-antitoxin system AbiEi family antitoxin domain-containing protein [Pseudolysinimonas sp.]